MVSNTIKELVSSLKSELTGIDEKDLTKSEKRMLAKIILIEKELVEIFLSNNVNATSKEEIEERYNTFNLPKISEEVKQDIISKVSTKLNTSNYASTNYVLKEEVIDDLILEEINELWKPNTKLPLP